MEIVCYGTVFARHPIAIALENGSLRWERQWDTERVRWGTLLRLNISVTVNGSFEQLACPLIGCLSWLC